MPECPSCTFSNPTETYFCGRCRLYLQPVGQYQLTRIIGKGGFASVYEATHMQSGASAAVKVLHQELVERDDIQRRFTREAQVLLGIESPYVVRFYDFGVAEELGAYMVMEWCDGQTLHQAMRMQPQDRFPPAMVRALFSQLLLGLDQIHAAGVVHRDLKPNNLMLVDAGLSKQLKILDFGVAWVEGEALTQSGVVIGSLMFMAPEQVRGQKDRFGPHTDVYAAGLLLAWMLTGRHIFGESSGESVALRHVTEAPPTLADLCPQVQWDPSLEAILATSLAKEPQHRFPTARAFLEALQKAHFPDFARSNTQPISLPDVDGTVPSISPFEETGTISSEWISSSPSEQGAGGAAPRESAIALVENTSAELSSHEDRPKSPPISQPAVVPSLPSPPALHPIPSSWSLGDGTGEKKSEPMLALGEREGVALSSRRRRASGRGKWFLILLLLALAAAAAYSWQPLTQWVETLLPSRGNATHLPATDASPQTTPEEQENQVVIPDITDEIEEQAKHTKIPKWILRLHYRWRNAWLLMAKGGLDPDGPMRAFYHEDFLDLSFKLSLSGMMAMRLKQARQCPGMRVELSHFKIQGQSKDEIAVEFQLSLSRALLTHPGAPRHVILKGKRIFEWKRVGKRWSIHRGHWIATP